MINVLTLGPQNYNCLIAKDSLLSIPSDIVHQMDLIVICGIIHKNRTEASIGELLKAIAPLPI